MNTSITLCVVFSCTLIFLFIFISEINPINNDNSLSFECGFDCLSEKNTTFSTNFIMLIMMFLIFDVEISVLIPFLTINKNNQTNTILISSIFITTLIVIILNEWNQGSLEWAN